MWVNRRPQADPQKSQEREGAGKRLHPSKGSRPAQGTHYPQRNWDRSEDLSYLLHSCQKNREQSRSGGWDSPETTRPKETRSNLRLPFRSPVRNCQQGDLEAREPVHGPEVSRDGQRHRGNEMDRQRLWLGKEKRGDDLTTSPSFTREIRQYQLQVVTFSASNSCRIIADSETFPRDGSLAINYSRSIAMKHERLFPYLCPIQPQRVHRSVLYVP
jgi:hypothetical protein